jgi:hypothetical protein
MFANTILIRGKNNTEVRDFILLLFYDFIYLFLLTGGERNYIDS